MQRTLPFCISIIASLMMSACSQQADSPDPNASPASDPGEIGLLSREEQAPADAFLASTEALAFTTPSQRGFSPGILTGALDGEAFFVAFGDCPYDDRGWQEELDPLGAIRCGYTYYASLDESGDLAFTGPQEPSGSVITGSGELSPDQLSLWGISFGLRPDGTVVDSDGNDIGFIGLGSMPLRD